MGPSSLQHLECSMCSTEHSVKQLQTVCGSCGELLLARYDLERAARTLTRERMTDRSATLWRYAEMLPGSDDPVSLGEGYTPLLRAQRLGQSLGLSRLWIKDESAQPTGSFKARGMTTAVTMARRLGATRLALPSAGNAGGAAAAYGALAGLAVDLYLPRWTPAPFLLEAQAYGAEVHIIDGDIADCGAQVRARTPETGWFDLSTLREPYRLEGKKTMGYELAEQFDGQLPDVVVYPTGGGTGLIGMWKAFEELERLGWIPTGQRPRMVVVQADGCAPMVRAYETGAPRAQRWANPATFAAGLCVPAAIGDHLILATVRESGGIALSVPDSAMAAAQARLGRLEGIFAAPEGGAAVAAVEELVSRGWISSDERVVVFNTGTGLKYPPQVTS
jgi:threonine synthase